jgi:hypothetical protein
LEQCHVRPLISQQKNKQEETLVVLSPSILEASQISQLEIISQISQLESDPFV